MMAHKAMKQRHWERISSITGVTLDVESETFQLRQLMSAPLLPNKEDIEVSKWRSGHLHIFLNVQKAFDNVSHPHLVMKQRRDFGTTGTLLDWSRRSQFTVLNKIRSDLFPLSIGVPQGSVWGPTFLLHLQTTCHLRPNGIVRHVSWRHHHVLYRRLTEHGFRAVEQGFVAGSLLGV